VSGMTKSEIKRLVNQYIGVSGGYLADFTYRSHADFYPEYCNLDIDPDEYNGTTRSRFEHILSISPPRDQARIIRGILAKYPPDSSSELRTPTRHSEFLRIAQRLEAASPVEVPIPHITSAVVERAIADAETLINSSGATSGVDRIHTALHGYLRAACDECGIAHSNDATMTSLFKMLRERHPAFGDLGPRSQDIVQILRSMSAVMDALNPIRNSASVAHPNEELLDGPEAMLVINSARTILHYLDAKLSATKMNAG